MNIIAVANQKGGVGKTTTVVNLGAALARKGKSVLCIDFDPQANLTNYVAGCQSWENTIASVMRAAVLFQPADIRETIYHSERFGFDFIPSDLRLSEADIYLATAMSRETVLRRVLEPVRQAYDYILIDCNPSLGLLLTNVLVASNQVIIPVQTQYFATQGLSSLEGVIGNVRMTLNPDLSTVNILLTLHPSMLRNLPHRYELSQLSVHCKQRSFHLRHDQCKVFSSQCQSLSLLKCFRR